MDNNKLQQAQRAGMTYALKIVKEGGIEALEKEVAFRGYTELPLVAPKKMVEYAKKSIHTIEDHTLDTVLTLSLYVLVKYFYFGTTKAHDYKDKFDEVTNELLRDEKKWPELVEDVEKLTGVKLSIRGYEK